MFFWHRIMSVRTALVRLNAFTYVVQRLELATGLFKHHSGKYHLRGFFQFRPLFSHDNLHISALDKLISFIPFLKVYVFFPLLSHVPSALVANIFVFFVTHENLIKTYLIFILSCLILCYLHVLQTIKYSLAARPIRRHANHWTHWNLSQIAKFMGSTWGLQLAYLGSWYTWLCPLIWSYGHVRLCVPTGQECVTGCLTDSGWLEWADSSVDI